MVATLAYKLTYPKLALAVSVLKGLSSCIGSFSPLEVLVMATGVGYQGSPVLNDFDSSLEHPG